MTTLEVALIGVSVTETVVSYWMYKRLKKRLERERLIDHLAYEQKRVELERIKEALPIPINVL